MATTNFELAAGMIEAECRNALEGVTDAKAALEITMKAGFNHWMFTDEQDQFKGAIGAAMVHLRSGDQYERIVKSFKQLQRASALISALQAGIPVDFENMETPEKDDTLLPLNQMWCDIKWPKQKENAA